MENPVNSEPRTLLISGLLEGKELAKQLLDPSNPIENQELLLERILAIFNQGLSMASFNLKSPRSSVAAAAAAASPRSERCIQDLDHHHLHDISNRRKILPRWTKRIRVGSGSGTALEGLLDDGYGWRKYGQKDILGSRFPRGYYRCTYQGTQGCLARKQVQRSDDDPTTFQVTYHGHHTCIQPSHHRSQPPSLPPPASPEAKIEQHQQPEKHDHPPPEYPESASAQLRVKTEDLDTNVNHHQMLPTTSSFSSVLMESENMETENYNTMADSFFPAFYSPECNYFLAYSRHIDGNIATGISESDLNESISALTSVANSPIGGFDFSLDQLGIDPSYPFDVAVFSDDPINMDFRNLEMV
ncbi:hypothetical protein Nepgr_024395 [Nepenthes gracilis]|uniref:WRKY domain-containing protein n=1 Tax=Nepenthes gracilis TaxID=150966 RepID=A0AAD3T4J1_NEPGR|nr:hypothetical protein Nepgr_024395 [Nepenthes gracilis]